MVDDAFKLTLDKNIFLTEMNLEKYYLLLIKIW